MSIDQVSNYPKKDSCVDSTARTIWDTRWQASLSS